MLGPDGVQHAAKVAGDAPLRLFQGLRQLAPQQVQQLRLGSVQSGEKQVFVGVKHHGLTDLALNQLPEKQVLVPQVLLAAAQQHGLVKSLADALNGRGDQEGVEAQTLGGGIGHHVAENGLVVLRLEPPQRGLHGVGGDVGVDVHVVIHQLAEHLGAVGNIGGGDDGDFAVQAVCQLQRAENVVHGELDFNNRKRQVLAQHAGRAAAGDHGVIVAVEIALRDLQALFAVADEQGQVHLRVFLSETCHQGFHALIRRDAQYTNTVIHKQSLPKL